MDDVIIFLLTKEQHVKDIDWVLKSLCDANMRVSVEKSNFFKSETEYLGFVVSRNGIKTCSDKVRARLKFRLHCTVSDRLRFSQLLQVFRERLRKSSQP